MAAEVAHRGALQQDRKVLLPARNGGHCDDVVNRLAKHGSIHRCVKWFREKQKRFSLNYWDGSLRPGWLI